MGKNRSSDKSRRAMQQHINAGYDIVTKGAYLKQPSKAELRASVPPYDESMVKRIESKPGKGKRRV
jgi:hypothetical protein